MAQDGVSGVDAAGVAASEECTFIGLKPQGERDWTSPNGALSRPPGTHPVSADLFLSKPNREEAPDLEAGRFFQTSLPVLVREFVGDELTGPVDQALLAELDFAPKGI